MILCHWCYFSDVRVYGSLDRHHHTPVSFITDHWFKVNKTCVNYVQVNTNGLLSFRRAINQYSSQSFPLNGKMKLIAPFWSDVDTASYQGYIYYRQTTDSHILDRATQDVQDGFVNLATFKSSLVFITTWYDVTYPTGNSSLVWLIIISTHNT